MYTEKLEIGYGWYDARKIEPMFEFGYGLSYTHFLYSDLSVRTAADNTLTVAFTLKNDGSVEGAEVPQVYHGINDKDEPPLRLAGWSKVDLKPAELNSWRVIPGSHVYEGAYSRDIRLKAN